MTPPNKPPRENDPPRRGAWQAQPPSGTRAPNPTQARPVSPGKTAAPREKPERPTPRSSPPNTPAAAGSRSAAAPPAVSPPPAAPAPARPRKQKPSGPPALVSRGEKILLWSLLASVAAMAFFLVHLRNRTHAHFQARVLPVPLLSAQGSPAPLILALASDTTGALTERPLAFPLPQDPNTRARVVLQKLLAEYTAPDSPHPLHPLPPGAQSVDEVYLSPAPGGRGELATVDLTGTFVHLHPSGIQPETLTLISILATLHANLPHVTEVRFLVDGEPRPTLAGHASLAQTYLAGPIQTAPREAFTVRP